jgi:hypothetical protein
MPINNHTSTLKISYIAMNSVINITPLTDFLLSESAVCRPNSEQHTGHIVYSLFHDAELVTDTSASGQC